MHQPGIEPGNPAWKADMLPLHHWCLKVFYYLLAKKTVHIGIEPMTLRLTAARSKPTELIDRFKNIYRKKC